MLWFIYIIIEKLIFGIFGSTLVTKNDDFLENLFKNVIEDKPKEVKNISLDNNPENIILYSKRVGRVAPILSEYIEEHAKNNFKSMENLFIKKSSH